MAYGNVRETGEKPRLVFANIPVAKLGFDAKTVTAKTILDRLLNDVYEIPYEEYTVNSTSCSLDRNTGLAKITAHFSPQVPKQLLNTQGPRKLLNYNQKHNLDIKVYSQKMCEFYYYLGKCPFRNGCSFSHEEVLSTNNITCQVCFEQKSRFGMLKCPNPTPNEANPNPDPEPKCKICVGCIMNWRKNSTYVEKAPEMGTTKQEMINKIKTCPSCRRFSKWVVLTRVWPKDEGEKQKIFEVYKRFCKHVRCPSYKIDDNGQGFGCPRGGKNCLFRHVRPGGNDDKDDEPFGAYDDLDISLLSDSSFVEDE